MSSDNTMKLIAVVHEPSKRGPSNGMRALKLSLLEVTGPDHITGGREDAGDYTKILEGVLKSRPNAQSIKEFRGRIDDIAFRVSPFDFSEDEMKLLFEEKRRGIARLELAKIRKALTRTVVSIRFIDAVSASPKDVGVDTGRLQSIAEQSAISAILGGQDERAAWSMKDSPKVGSKRLPTQQEIEFHINSIRNQCWTLTNSLGLIEGLIIREEKEHDVDIRGHIEPALKLLTCLCDYIEDNLPEKGSTPLRSAIWRIKNALPSG